MGLAYYSRNIVGARYYDPVLGIWLSPDPARQFSNPYNGMGGDPVNGVDPDGEFVITAIVVGAARSNSAWPRADNAV